MMINDNSAIVYCGDSDGDFCGDFNQIFVRNLIGHFMHKFNKYTKIIVTPL